MKTVKSIHVAPVKSLGLAYPRAVHVGWRGIVEDRRLYLIDSGGSLLTQREIGWLVQIKAEYQADPEWLRLRLPTGATLEGGLGLGEPATTLFWGRYVTGRVVTGDWNDALSDYCQQPVRLVRSEEAGQCHDEYPVSLVSQASIQELSKQPGAEVTFDSRRFRPSFLLDGCEAHEEDAWLGSVIQIGRELRLRLAARDPRCALTTLNPATGDRDADTLRLILSYRPSDKAAYFGVYGTVERPGAVSLGDEVTLHRTASPVSGPT